MRGRGMAQNRQFILVQRPDGTPQPDDFAIETTAVPELREGEFLIRNHYASLDPGIRPRLDAGDSYMPPIETGAPIAATTLGVIEASRAPEFSPGQWVMGMNTIGDYAIGTAGGFTRIIDPDAVPEITNYLSALGAVGMTSYFGYLEVGQPRGDDVVLVSAAAGAVGSVVGQIARIRGAKKIIGIAGGPEKCARLIERYGYDAAIDYRGKDVEELSAAIRAEAPGGIDIVFENVGGTVLDAALLNLAHEARVVLCGLISEYNSPEKIGARNLWRLLVSQASIHGFLVLKFIDRFPEGMAQMAEWIRNGQLIADEHVEDGLDNAYAAFMRLFSGSNHGKMILRIA